MHQTASREDKVAVLTSNTRGQNALMQALIQFFHSCPPGHKAVLADRIVSTAGRGAIEAGPPEEVGVPQGDFWGDQGGPPKGHCPCAWPPSGKTCPRKACQNAARRA